MCRALSVNLPLPGAFARFLGMPLIDTAIYVFTRLKRYPPRKQNGKTARKTAEIRKPALSAGICYLDAHFDTGLQVGARSG